MRSEQALRDLRNCTGKTQGHLFRVGETFLMQLHRSRPEPRLSTFERCWLSGATGLADRRHARLIRAPLPRISQPALPDVRATALLAKPVNGINAPQRPDCVAGVGDSNSEMSSQNIPLKGRTDFRIPAAETKRRWEAQLGPSATISAGCLRWQELPQFSAQYGAATTQTPRRPRAGYFATTFLSSP